MTTSVDELRGSAIAVPGVRGPIPVERRRRDILLLLAAVRVLLSAIVLVIYRDLEYDSLPIEERALLFRRLAFLKRTKKLFDMWHVLHRPLACLLLAIVAVHVATAFYLGYAYGP